GLLLAGLPEHTADRFANEEFPFVEHTVRIAAEPFKVSCAATQLGKQRQERRAANPEVVIDRPSVEDVEQPRRAFHQWARDRDGQFVDEGPRLRRRIKRSSSVMSLRRRSGSKASRKRTAIIRHANNGRSQSAVVSSTSPCR